ncbi:MAG: suppressor of fused domain protein [Cyanobacteria bacterium J06621_11]
MSKEKKQEQKSLFEQIWEYREEDLYPTLFGQKHRGIFVLTPELFTQGFKQSSYDPRWLTYGVIEFEPTEDRNSWLYVTSGASNPWNGDSSTYASQEYSGFGAELVLEVTEQSQWAIVVLQRLLAFNILLTVGRYGEAPALDYGHRIPLRQPIDGKNSLLTDIVISKPAHYPDSFTLKSGQVDFLHAIGITASERDYAQKCGSDQLLEQLKHAGAAPITDASRTAVV